MSILSSIVMWRAMCFTCLALREPHAAECEATRDKPFADGCAPPSTPSLLSPILYGSLPVLQQVLPRQCWI
jgi:hypothetical protein